MGTHRLILDLMDYQTVLSQQIDSVVFPNEQQPSNFIYPNITQ